MKNNSSFPHPVLGVNHGVMPDLDDDALQLTSVTETEDSYIYVYQLKQNNVQIERYINEQHAEYICEIDCVKTFYKNTIHSYDPEIKVELKKSDVTGHIDLYFYVVTTCAFPAYTNKFNDDFRDPETGKMPSFKLDKGSVLVMFGKDSDDVNTRFNNKPDIRSFVQVVKRQDDEKNVDIVFTDETINIELPNEMFTDFVNYNQKQYRGIFYTSLIFNALVKGILNVEKNEGALWADSIKAMVEESPDKYKGLSIEEPADAVDIATIMLSNYAYGSPYDLLFQSINELQN
jgi:hypothetical protein